VDPQSSYSVIRTAGGDPGLLVLVDEIRQSGSQWVKVWVVKTGVEARTLRCEVVTGRLERSAVS
jgi:hypothetical protein